MLNNRKRSKSYQKQMRNDQKGSTKLLTKSKMATKRWKMTKKTHKLSVWGVLCRRGGCINLSVPRGPFSHPCSPTVWSTSSCIWWHWHITTVLIELSRFSPLGHLLFTSSSSAGGFGSSGKAAGLPGPPAASPPQQTQSGKLSARTKRDRKCAKS